MANTIRLKRASGSDPSASDLVTGELAVRTDTGKLFTKKDDNSVSEIGGGLSNLVEDTSPQLGGDLQTNGNNISFSDDDELRFGAGDDLIVEHNGTRNIIKTMNGDVNIRYSAQEMIVAKPSGAVELYHNNSKKFETNSAGAAVTGNLSFGDSGIASFGDSGDLQIQHNGTHSYIQDTGTGDLILAASKTRLMNTAANETCLSAEADGAVELYFNNVKKLYTYVDGAKVEGDFVFKQADGTTKASWSGTGDRINVKDSTKFTAGDGDDLQIFHNGSQSIITDTANPVFLKGNQVHLQSANGNMISCYQDAQTELFFNENKKLATASGGIDVTGNITVSGTVDGRDLATDGSKLDGIESGATADQTAGEIKTLLQSDKLTASEIANDTITAVQLANNSANVNVIADGAVTFAKVASVSQNRIAGRVSSGSGVLEELTAANVRSMINVADGATNVTNNNQLTNGAGYITSADGGNAATLDSIDSSQFLRSDTADTATGVLTINGGLSFGADAKCPAAVSSLSDGSTVTVDFTSGIHHSVTLGGNRTLSQVNNANAIGQSGSIFITQDGTGSRTLSFNSAYKFVGGTAPTLSTAANAVDRLDYVIKSSGVIHCVVSLDVK